MILGLGDVAQNLAGALPTAPVLSALLTAAPPSFISNIVHDRTFAEAFQSEFAAGSSPSWFNALPTSVKSYLHTYSGFGRLAQAAGAVQSGALTETSSTKATSGSAKSATAATATATATDSAAESVSEKAATGGTATSSAPSSTSTPNSAAKPSGALSASLVGVIGILGLAIAL